MTEKNAQFMRYAGGLALAVLGMSALWAGLAFGQAGVGSGELAIDAGKNISIGDSPDADVKLLVKAIGTNLYGFEVKNASNESLFAVETDGDATFLGTITADNLTGGTFSGTVSATNISLGQFGANTGGGAYSFPSTVGVTGDLTAGRLCISGVSCKSSWTADSITWGNVSGKPTTVAGYGITDMSSQTVSYALTAGTASASDVTAYAKQLNQYVNTNSDPTFNSVYLANSNNRLYQGTGNTLHVQTPSGYIEMGPQNTSWAHFTTDRGQFYFGSPVYVNGSVCVYGGNCFVPNGGTFTSGPYTNDWFRVNGTANGIYWGSTGAGIYSPYANEIWTYGSKNRIVIGGGNGKINVGTVDPPYTINGDKFATYMPAMVGQKEETTDIVRLPESRELVLDFKRAEKGSDLWLFAKVTNLKQNFNKMVVLLTPGFAGKAWYEKDVANLRLIIKGDATGEVSYRLSAPRFDSDKLPNTRGADDKSTGLIVNDAD